MTFSCLSHIFANLTTATQAVHKPGHLGLIHRASCPTNTTSTFPPAPNQPTTAFAPNSVSGAAFRERIQEILSGPQTPEQNETTDKGKGEDGTSWVLASKDVDGWDVGREKATQMFVKRKGRGRFKFEEAMVEGWGLELREEGESNGVLGAWNKDWEVVARGGLLEDGFEYRGWIVE